jgi:predicted MFS family arabinose efflux permease
MGRVWLFTFANITFMMVIWLIDASLAALLPEIAEIYRDVTVVQGAQLVTIYNIGFMVASFIFGPLGDVLHRFKLVIIAGILFLSAGILFAAARNFPAAMLLRFVAGFSGGMLTVNLWSGLIHEVPKKHFNTAIGLMAGTRAYSFVLGLPLVMKLVDWIGWTPTFLTLGSIIVLPLILFSLSSKRPHSLQKGGSLNPFVHFRETIRLPGIFRSLCGFFELGSLCVFESLVI